MTTIESCKNCTGCEACYNICPVNAIKMQENKEGFLYPVIDKNLCTQCGKCYAICPEINLEFRNLNKPYCYALMVEDEKIWQSSSGGAFSFIAEEILKKDGYVCGAAYNDKFVVEHIIISDIKDLVKLQSSKYVQSDIKNCYNEIKELLETEKQVLFSGTPCQVAGLYSFLGKQEYKNLLTVDLVCHGVPSPKAFSQYISEFVGKDEEIVEINFREKSVKRGCTQLLKIKTNKNEYLLPVSVSDYYRAFLFDLISRKSCHSCKYAKIQRIADITVGDFWGIENFDRNLDTSKGVSLVLTNNLSAERFLRDLNKKNIIIKSVPLNISLKKNKVLQNPFKPHKNRELFFKNIDKLSFKKNVEYCLDGKGDVALLNFCLHPNYGAALTAYALQEIIKQLNYTVKLINFQVYWNSTKLNDGFYEKMHKDSFTEPFVNEYLQLTERILTEEDFQNLNTKFDTFVVGSDQVFRDDFVKNFIDKYFLGFTNVDKKRIAFAASFGKDYSEFDMYSKQKVKNLLKRFDYISTREEIGTSICKTEFDCSADWLIEPVFLLDEEYWSNLAMESDLDFTGKIITYFFASEKENQKMKTFLEQKYNKEVVNMFNSKYSVQEWLKAIQTCDFIVTNSFHGVCFALIFNTKICLVDVVMLKARTKSIFKILGINYDFLSNNEFDKGFVDYNFDSIRGEIKKQKEFAILKLKEILEKPKEIRTKDLIYENIDVKSKNSKLKTQISLQQDKIEEQQKQINQILQKFNTLKKRTLFQKLQLLSMALR